MFPSSNFLSSVMMTGGAGAGCITSYNHQQYHRSRLMFYVPVAECFNTNTYHVLSSSTNNKTNTNITSLKHHNSNSNNINNMTCDNLISLLRSSNDNNINGGDVLVDKSSLCSVKNNVSISNKSPTSYCQMLFTSTSTLTTIIMSTALAQISTLSKWLWSLICHPYMLLTYFIFITYWPSLWADLVFDDRPAIIQNQDLRPNVAWSRLWFNDYWGMPLKSPLSHKSYRPLTVLTFRLNYLHHQLSPFGYHLVNLLLHSIVTVLFYILCQRFSLSSFGELQMPCNALSTTNNNKNAQHEPASCNMKETKTAQPTRQSITLLQSIQSTPFLMATIFAVHPIHTDCVCSVVGRAELLSAIFYLLSILCWNNPSRNSCASSFNHNLYEIVKNYVHKYRYRLCSIMFALLGFLCKEQCIFVLVYLAVQHLIGHQHQSTSSINHHAHHKHAYQTIIRQRIQRNIPTINMLIKHWLRLTYKHYRTLTILAFTFLCATYIRFSLMGYSLPIFNRFDNPASRASFPYKHLTYGYIALYHYWLMLFPDDLSCDWTHSSIELIDFNMHQLKNPTPANTNMNMFSLLTQLPGSIIYFDLCRAVLVLLTFCLMAIMAYYLSSSLLFVQQQQQLDNNNNSNNNNNYKNNKNQQNQNRRQNARMTKNGTATKNPYWFTVRNGFKARNNQQQQQTIQVHQTRNTLKTLALTFIPFLPVSNLFFPVGFVIAERVLYLPSIGFLILLGIAIDYLFYNNKKLLDIFGSHKSFTEKTFKPNKNAANFHNNDEDVKKRSKRNNNLSIIIKISIIIIIITYSFKTYSRSNNWTNEFQLYESGLKVNPRNTKLLNNLGRLHEKFNQTNMAIDLYMKAIKVEPKDLRSYLNLGNVLIKRNDRNAAERIFRQALKQADDDATVTDEMVLLHHLDDNNNNNDYYLDHEDHHHNHNNYPGSAAGITPPLTLSSASSTLSPLYLTTLIRLAELLHNNNENDDNNNSNHSSDLKMIHEKIFKIQSSTMFQYYPLMVHSSSGMMMDDNYASTSCCPPSTPSSSLYNQMDYESNSQTLDHLYNMGVVHYHQGHLNEALQYFEQVLLLNPYHENTLLTSARIIQDENLDQMKHVAYERLNQLVQLGKDDEFIYFNLARLSVGNNRFEEARHLFKKAIEKRESFTEAHFNLALLLVKEMNYNNNNNNNNNNNQNGHQHNHQQQYEKYYNTKMDRLNEAIYHLKRVLQINPKHENSMFVLGELYADELNEFHHSEYYYKMIIETVNPDNREARHNLCVLAQKQGNIDKAIQCYQNILLDTSNNINIKNNEAKSKKQKSKKKHHKKSLKLNANYYKMVKKQIDILMNIKQQQGQHGQYYWDNPEEDPDSIHRQESCLNASNEHQTSNIRDQYNQYKHLFVSSHVDYFSSTMCFI